jgi:hypothetical protein
MSNVENTKNGARNIIVGNVDSAEIVYTAHYDTTAKSLLPSFIFPKIPILTTLYQVMLGLLILLPAAALFTISVLLLPATGLSLSICVLAGIILAAVVFVFSLRFLMCGRSCKNNANSNTSGVATLFEAMADMPSEYRSRVAFIFFDGTINGLVGSSDFAKKHKHLNKKLFLNFDCVGVGDDFVVAFRSGAAKYVAAIEKAFASTSKFKTQVISGGKRLPSDHNNFKCGVGVSAFKKKNSTLYLDITNDDTDTVCNSDNVDYAAAAAVNVAKFIFDPNAMSTPAFESRAAQGVEPVLAFSETPASDAADSSATAEVSENK